MLSSTIRSINPTVAKLLSINDRQKAFDQIVSWQRYIGEKKYEEKCGDVGHVLFCPQQNGTPLIMVFCGEEGKTDGRYTLLTGEGNIVSTYDGSNYFSKYDVLSDINNDGIIERVYSNNLGDINYREVRYKSIVVLPMTMMQKPLLKVLYGIGKDIVPWRWKFVQDSNGRCVIDIDIKVDSFVETVASYYWSQLDNDYVGPNGGVEKDFWRIDNEDELECYMKVHQKLIQLRVKVQ